MPCKLLLCCAFEKDRKGKPILVPHRYNHRPKYNHHGDSKRTMFREGEGLKEMVAAGVLVQLSILLVLSSEKSRVVLEMFTAVIIYMCVYM